MEERKSVHPLLLESGFWQRRLRDLDDENLGLFFTPREDLSAPGCEVVEFRLRAHDGERLWGLLARPAWQSGECPARVRAVGPAERPEVAVDRVREGCAEFVYQHPAGRRLEDRVLDVVRVCQIAFRTAGIDRYHVRLADDECASEAERDEYRIAGELLERQMSA